jgi:agmatine deiminase
MLETPHQLGYRMPAEWERHAATWIAWPHNEEDWPGRFGPIPWVFVDIVKHLHRLELVRILVNHEQAKEEATAKLKRAGVDLGRVTFHLWPTNRVWTRDYAPIFVRSHAGELALTNWKFNAWAKYDDWQQDNAVPDRVAQTLDLRQWKPTCKDGLVVLEGGSIDVNGQGTLLTTEECLLSEVQERNPGLGRKELEHFFAEFLGVRKVLWLKRGIAGDDTHGHVDDLARFVSPDTVVAVVEEDPGDVNFEPTQENLQLLRDMTDQAGRPLRVVALPLPAPVIFDGQRLPASYANFYVANGLVLVPTFNDEKDRIALGRLADLFPDRSVIGIHCGDLIWGLGAIHCMTQQQPSNDDV